MNLSLDELRSLLHVANAGQFSAAARDLGITQPALSAMVSRLENRLGVALFHRLARGVAPTRAGDRLLARVRPMLREWEQLVASLRDEQEQVSGRYTIGVNPTLAAYTLPLFLPKMLQDWPGLEVNLLHDLSRQIAQDVLELRCDLGIVVNPPRHPDLTIVKLYPDELRFWLHQDSPWHEQSQQVPVLCHPQMLQTERMLQQLARLRRYSSLRIVHSNDLYVILRLIQENCGLGLLPRTVVAAHEQHQLVALADGPTRRDTITLIWRRDSQDSQASRVMREAIVRALRQNPAPEASDGFER